MKQTTYDQFARALLLLQHNEPLVAVRVLEPVVADEPVNRSLRETLGLAYFRTAQLNHARAEFEVLAELDPSDDRAHFLLGRTWERLRQPDKAGRSYRIANALHPSDEYGDALARVEAAPEPRSESRP